MRLRITLFLLFISLTALANTEAPQSFTYEGKLYDFAKQPLAESVTFRIQIYNQAKDCLLYEETQVQDLSTTNGVFALNVGTPTGDPKRSGNDPNRSMWQIFKNVGTLTGLPAPECPATNYSPAVGEKRILRVHITPSSTGIEETLAPDQAMNSVPTAVMSESLQGIGSDGFVQVTGSVTQAVMEDLAAGTSALYLKAGDDAQFGDGVNYTNNGQVAIGTSTPDANAELEIENNAPTIRLEANPASGGDASIDFQSGANSQARIYSTEGTQELHIATGNPVVDALIIDGSQNATFMSTLQATTIVSNPSGVLTGQAGEVRMRELVANGTEYVGFKAPDAIGASVSWTLPNADGSNGDVLTTNGSGTLSWVAAGAGDMTKAVYDTGDNGIVDNAEALQGNVLGTAANNIVQLNASAQLPAIDGSNLTNINAVQLQGRDVLNTAPTDGFALKWVNANNRWEPVADSGITAETDPTVTAFAKAALPNCPAGQILTGDGTNLSCVADDDTDATKLPLDGSGTMAGHLDMGTTNRIENLANPAAATDAVNRGWMDSAISTAGGSYVAVAGDNMTGNLTMDAQGEVRLADSAGGEYVALRAPTTVGSNSTYTLPAAPDNGKYLTTDGTGNLSWGTPGGGGDLISTNNLSDVANAGTARTNLGLGTAAVENVGTGANNVVQLNGSSQLPAVDGSALTNINAVQLQGRDVFNTAPTDGFALKWVNANNRWEPVADSGITTETDPTVTAFAKAALPNCPAGQILTGDGTGLSCVADDDTDATKLPLAGGNMAGNIVMDAQGEIRLADSAGGEYLALRAPATVGSNATYTFPAAPDNGKYLTTDGTGNLSWGTPGGGGDLISTNNLSDVANAATARTNLGLGTAAVETVGTGANNVVQLNGSSQLPAIDGSNLSNINAVQLQGRDVLNAVPTDGFALKWVNANNRWEPVADAGITTESDPTVTAFAKAALPNCSAGQILTGNGTSLSCVADDSGGAGDLLAANNLSDVANAATSRTNLGLAIGTDVQAYDAQLADVAGLAPTADNFIAGDGTNFVLKTPTTARTSLGLGSAAVEDVGTGAGNVVQLNGSSQLPAVDGSLLTGVSATDSSKVPLAGGTMTGNLVMGGSTANVQLGSNYLSGDGDDEGVFIDTSGNVAVGSASTAAKLGVTGDLLSSGTFTSTASVPESGAGTRMFFDVESGSFRAGEAAGTDWDNTNVGDYSVALGAWNIASGNHSVAIGRETVSSGSQSTAIGYGPTASAAHSVSIGYYATASQNYATAIGRSPTASGADSVAIGEDAVASGTNSIAIGDSIEASGAHTVAIALNNQAGFNVTQANAMAIMGGDVGIGTATPGQKLDVNGNVNVQGTIAMNTNKITGLAAPTASADAATKAYVDASGGGGGVPDDMITLTPTSGNVAVDASLGTGFSLTTTGDATLLNPTNIATNGVGHMYMMRVVRSPDHEVTFSSNYFLSPTRTILGNVTTGNFPPTMFSNNVPSPWVLDSHSVYNSQEPYLAFDADNTTYASMTDGSNRWIRIDMGSTQRGAISSYEIGASNTGNAPVNWQLEGSDNGFSWTTLDTRSGVTTGWEGNGGNPQAFQVDPIYHSSFYRYFRIYMTLNDGGGYYTIYDLKFNGMTINSTDTITEIYKFLNTGAELINEEAWMNVQ